MNYLCNGFSFKMLKDGYLKPIPYPLTESEFVNIVHRLPFKTAIGHEDLVHYLNRICTKKIQLNRQTIRVGEEDLLIVCTVDQRLPEYPEKVNYNGNLVYKLVRFEKQNSKDILKSEQIVNEIIKMEA